MKEEPGPQHEICRKNVDFPIILFVNKDKETKKVSIQWFGEANKKLQKGSQFLFDIVLNPDEELLWWDHPEWFNVVFLGQIRNWPNSLVAQQIANNIDDGNLNRWVVWVCNHKVQMKYQHSIGPQSFLAKLVLLGDPNVGVITPQPYQNFEVLKPKHRA